MAPLEKILNPGSFRGILPDGNEIEVPLRISTRSRRISLRSCKSGFELVLPVGFPLEQAYSFFQENLPWIEKIWKEKEKFLKNRSQTEKVLPAEIFLTFTGTLFQVEYSPVFVRKTMVKQEGSRLIVHRDFSGDTSSVTDALRKWLIRYSGSHLLPHAENIAETHGFSSLSKLRTGIQKRSWGTCNRNGVVTLNAALLFFQKNLAEYVILHEFCHLTEMNHSSRFWEKMESVYPGAKEARESLKYAQQLLPWWVFPE